MSLELSSKLFDLSALEKIISPCLPLDSDAEPMRVVHGRGGLFVGLEQLTLDRYGDLLVGIIHQPIGEKMRQQLLDLLSKWSPRGILQDRSCRPHVEHFSWGELAREEVIFENKLKYQLQLGAQQNIGFFPDMVLGRKWVEENGLNKNILNLFAFTCSFSVAALAGGASKVINLDMSGPSLERGRLNHRLNQQNLEQVKFLKLDLMKSWGRVAKHGPYDLVVCDPPTYQNHSFDVDRDYPKVLRRLLNMLNENGRILACLNSPHHAWSEFLSFCPPELEEKGRILPSKDFENFNSEYGLKILILAKK